MSSPILLCRRLTCAVQNNISQGFKEKELASLEKVKGLIKCHLPGPTLNTQQVSLSEKRLLVLMVGWAQSRHSVLSKYAGLYTRLGFPCMAISNHVANIWYTSLGNRLVNQALHSLDQSLEIPVSILYHIFSGGGTVVFPGLLQEQDKSDSLLSNKLVPTGIIFDSGPTIFSNESGLAASKLVYDQGGYNVFTYHLFNTIGVTLNAIIGSRKRSELEAALDHPQLLHFPQLYLHSNTDTVTPPEVVEKVMEEQKSKGRDVSSHCWTGTEHVRHFTVHPQEYTEKITEFIKTKL